MPKRKPDLTRESRVTDEIVVDAYTAEERALTWYYYLEEQFGFPFKAKCIAPRATSPLKKGEEVEVVKMAREDDCMQLDAIGVDEATREAI